MILIKKIENKNIYLGVSIINYGINEMAYYFELGDKNGNTLYTVAITAVVYDIKRNRITCIQPHECNTLSKKYNISLENIVEILKSIYNVSMYIGAKNGIYKPLINRQYTLNQYLKIIGKYKT